MRVAPSGNKSAHKLETTSSGHYRNECPDRKKRHGTKQTALTGQWANDQWAMGKANKSDALTVGTGYSTAEAFKAVLHTRSLLEFASRLCHPLNGSHPDVHDTGHFASSPLLPSGLWLYRKADAQPHVFRATGGRWRKRGVGAIWKLQR